MHELALMESVVEAVTDQIDGQRVALVRLEIGELAGVVDDALRFCFDVCAKGTNLEGAELAILSIPARARCQTCGSEYALRSFATPCPCGSFERKVLSGTELRLKDVEVH